MPTQKVTKSTRRKNATRKQRKSHRQRKPITHSRRRRRTRTTHRRRRTRTTHRRRKGGDRNAIYGDDAAKEARLAIHDPEIAKALNYELLSECINEKCKTEATKWADDWAVVNSNPSLLHTYMPTIKSSKANLAKACAQCDTKLGLKPGTTLTTAMRNENSTNRPMSY